MFIRNASPTRDSPTAGTGSRTMPEPSISGWFAESASSATQPQLFPDLWPGVVRRAGDE